jgi:putative ABC transport system permease protein
MQSVNNIHPPQWPLRLLRFFLKKEYLEEIEGDMEEIFYDHVQKLSLRKAKTLYAIEMVKLLRPALLKNFAFVNYLNRFPMLDNYFKVSFRNLMRNPLNSFINVFGLALAIGVCMLVYAFGRWTYSTDQFHVNKNEVHLVTFFANRDGRLQEFGQSPRPLAEVMRQDFPQIIKSSRVEDRNVVMKYEDHVFHERVRYADPDFLEMFTFPLKWGTSSSLKDVNSIILSEEASIKYFGDENPIGQSILMKFDKTRSKAFKITGVAKRFPDAHTIDFNFLINLENFRTEPNYHFDDWKQMVNATFIQVANPVAEIPTIQRGMAKYKTFQNQAAEEDWAIESFAFQPLATLHINSGDIRNDISASSDSNQKSIGFLVIVGGLLLILACLNYINIAIVSATKRLKEIGVRKTIGATRKVVIAQFLTENIVVTLFALTIGFLMGVFFFIPWFEGMFNNLDMEFSIADPNLWIYLPCILLFTALASGIYPSLYISRFQVVRIMKGSVEFGKRNPLTKVVLTVQLILTCLFITSAVMFTWNVDYLNNREWGYNKSDALYVAVPDKAAYEKLYNLIKQNPKVVSISGSQHHVGKSHSSIIMQWPERQFEADALEVDANYFETMGLPLKEGRIFQEDMESEKQRVVVNETLVKNIALQQPLNKVFKIDSVEYEIIGVVKDFHAYSFTNTIKPMMLRLADEENYKYLSIKVQRGTQPEAYKELQAAWTSLYPETPFDGGYQEDVWGGYYAFIANHGKVWRLFATIAILLSCLGLYGLITLNIAGRVRELSIRKVLGAGVANLSNNVVRQYLLLVSIAIAIGGPAGYFMIRAVFDLAYKYHMPVTPAGALSAISILIIVLVITISTQIRKVLRLNPVDGLKVE